MPTVVCVIAAALVSQTADGLELARAEQQAFRRAAIAAAPSVVRIETVGGLDKLGDVQLNTGATTGTVVAPGLVLSSAFNFAGEPSAIFATLADGTRVAAERVATDHVRQLVLLRLAELDGAEPIRPASRERLRVGQWAVALGRTYDQPGPNLSVGLLSATSRLWGLAMQTDAKVSPTNYGGPLVDLDGRAIGILVPLSPQKQGETAGLEWYDSGIGFLIPIDDALAAARRLESGDDLSPGRIGIGLTGSGLVAEPATIDRVHPRGPADEAGIAEGDEILAIDGERLAHTGEFKRAITGRYAGDEIAMTLRRANVAEANGRYDVTITLVDELPEYEFPSVGLLLAADATVRRVDENGPAAGQVAVGDRITKIGETEVATAAEAIDAIDRGMVGREIAIAVSGKGGERTVTLTTAAIATDLPDTIAPPQLEAIETDDERGTVRKTAEGSELTFAAYLPKVAGDGQPCGLLVWLDGGNPIARFQAECESRNIALLVPTPPEGGRGFGLGDLDDLQAAIATVGRLVPLDPARIAVHASGQAAGVAVALAEGEGVPIGGVILDRPLIRKPPSATDPAHRLVWLILGQESPTQRRLIDFLDTRRHPIGVSETADEATIIRWVDWLGRI